MKPISRDPPPWLPGFSKAGQVLVLALGALLTATAWFYQTGTIQLIVALIGQGFWVLAYLNWQRGQQAPRVIRDLLPNVANWVPCQVWVVVEGVGVFRDTGVLVPVQTGLEFKGLRTTFVLEPKDVRLVEEPNFGSDARVIGLKSPDFQMRLKIIPYRGLGGDSTDDPRGRFFEIVRNLGAALRYNQDLRPPSLPTVPFNQFDYWSMLLRAWCRRGLGVCLFVLVCLSMGHYMVDWIALVIVGALMGISYGLYIRGNAAREASSYIRHQLDVARQQSIPLRESETLSQTS